MTHIYYISCSGNHKGYIGSTVDIKSRMWAHFGDLKGNKHHSKYMQHSYNKHGKDKFSVQTIAKCPNEYRDKLERWFIQKSSLNTDFNSRVNEDVRYGYKAHNRGLTDIQLNEVVTLLSQGLSCKEVHRRLGIKYSIVWSVKSKRQYQLDSNIPEKVSNKVYQSRLQEEDILDIISMLNENVSQKQIAEKYRVTASTISAIKAGRSFEKYFHLVKVNVNPVKILSETDIIKIVALFKEGYNNHEIAKKFNVNPCTISDIRVGKSWNKITGFPKRSDKNPDILTYLNK